jgi:hypothetical protein
MTENLWPSLPDVDDPKEGVEEMTKDQAAEMWRQEWAGGEVARLKRILAAIDAEARLQAAHLDEYGDRLTVDEREDRLALLFTFRRLANGIGPDGHEIK